MPTLEAEPTIKIQDPINSNKSNSSDFYSWRTIIFNCDCHSFNDAISAIQAATKCSREKAEQAAMNAHKNGSAVIYMGYREKAEMVAEVISQRGLRASVNQ